VVNDVKSLLMLRQTARRAGVWRSGGVSSRILASSLDGGDW
jgi:hypothetical protein